MGQPVDDTVDPSTIATDADALYLGMSESQGALKDPPPGRSAVFEHNFAKPLPIVPTVIYGFRRIDVYPTNAPRVALSLPSVSEIGFTLLAKSYLHKTANLEANIMVLPNGKIPFQHGYFDASDNPGGRAPNQNASSVVNFAVPFKAPPKVFVWFTEISQPRTQRCLKTYINNITGRRMTVNIDTWGGREFEGARVAWLAWPAEFDGKTIRAANFSFSKGEKTAEEPWYGGSFRKDPKVFCAINYIDFQESSSSILRMLASHVWATKDKLSLEGGTWGDTDIMNKLELCWIAVE